MTDVTRILSQIEEGDGKAAEQLLPLVYDELRKLAAQKMAQEAPGQTLQALALMDHPNIARVHDGGTTRSGVRFGYKLHLLVTARPEVWWAYRIRSIRGGNSWWCASIMPKPASWRLPRPG
jgi:hypothetical protein